VSTFEGDTWRSVSFWTEKLTEVLIRSFPITEVSSVMQIETQGLKNKVSKTQGLKRCLTHLFIYFVDKYDRRRINVINRSSGQVVQSV